MTDLTPAARTRLFWACFIALVTTAFAFMLRVQLMSEWELAFGLDKTQAGTIMGAGFWPFGVSIVLFSLVLDRVGYGAAMGFAICSFIAFALLSIFASGFAMLYWASILGGLGAGAVEAVINPLIADMYKHNKTTWLNILHAGWPGGLVITGVVVLGIGDAMSWQWKIGLILIPAIVSGVMMLGVQFPVSQRLVAGVSYREMLAQVGWGGAFIVALMIVMELTTNVFGIAALQQFWVQAAIAAAIAAVYGAYARSFGRPIFVFLLLVMLALATTELGTDAWVKDLLAPAINSAMGIDSGWVLVYTAAIMMVLRFSCGPLIGAFKPLGVLALSAAVVTVGIWWLAILADEVAVGALVILTAATIYGIGQTFFWPTTLGFVSEQFPRGGPMTLNLIAGVGMLGVGVLGNPWLGNVQDTRVVEALQTANPVIAAEYVGEPKSGIFGAYASLTPDAAHATGEHAMAIADASRSGKADALAAVSVLPIFMLVSYLGLMLYYRRRGGYRPVEI
jgi:MFS family permease